VARRNNVRRPVNNGTRKRWLALGIGIGLRLGKGFYGYLDYVGAHRKAATLQL
jgi:hypothetical protein